MKVSGRLEVLAGLVLPLLMLATLAVVGMNAEESGVAIAFMTAVPMFAAMVTRALFTGIVAFATVLAAAVTAAATYGQSFADALPIMIGVIIGAGIAVVVSQIAVAPPRRVREPVAAPASTGPSPAAADVDELTGLPTREAVAASLSGGTRRGPQVLALLDVDDLSGFNATHGSDVGDVLLFAIAGRTRYALAEPDLVARWGGNQFLVVMAGELAAAMPTVGLITEKVNMNPIRTDSGLLPASMSVGVAMIAS